MAAKPGRSGKPASYEDILALPENKIGEIADWRAIRVATASAAALTGCEQLGRRISSDPFPRVGGGPGGWLILDEPELHMGADILVPDIAGWRRERMPRLPTTAWFELAPDWVCEVLSPSTALLDSNAETTNLRPRNGVIVAVVCGSPGPLAGGLAPRTR